MKQSLDTRTKLLTKNPISLMIELSIPAVLGMVVVGLYNSPQYNTGRVSASNIQVRICEGE